MQKVHQIDKKNKTLRKNIKFLLITGCLLLLSSSLILPPFKELSKGIFWGEIDSLTYIESLIFVFIIFCIEAIVFYKFYLQNSSFKSKSKTI